MMTGLYLTLSRRVDCLITSGPPHSSHILGWVLRRTAVRRWIVDYRDLWTDDPFQCKHRGLLLKLFERIERNVIKTADAIVTVSPFWRDHLRTKFSLEKRPDRFVLIRNGFNIDETMPRQAGHEGKAERIHIHSSGTPQALSATSSLLDALSKIRSTDVSEDHFPLVTFTGFSEEYKQGVQARHLERHVVDVGALSQQRSIEYSLGCDVLMVIVNDDNPSRRGTIPAKTYEAMALGRHILAIVPPLSDVSPLLEEYGNATICNVNDSNDICSGLMRLMAAHREQKLGASGTHLQDRQIMMKKYSRESQGRELVSLIESLL